MTEVNGIRQALLNKERVVDIARKFGVSEGTVRYHRTALEKLGNQFEDRVHRPVDQERIIYRLIVQGYNDKEIQSMTEYDLNQIQRVRMVFPCEVDDMIKTAADRSIPVKMLIEWECTRLKILECAKIRSEERLVIQ